VESLSRPEGVTFEVLRARLLHQVKLRINNGEFTERGLARILGLSQSQTHNVLKGARTLQMPLADRILTKLGLCAMDLLSESELGLILRPKMAEWDRELAANSQNDTTRQTLGLEELFGVKKPTVPSEPREIP
jgi:plasmid maintenance system antidote protein VapI